MSEPWTAKVLSLFPEIFPGPLGCSLAGKALAAGIWRLEVEDIRSFARDRHRTVDASPTGGGPGMILRPDIIAAAIDHSVADANVAGARLRSIFLSPRGRVLDQALVQELANGPGVILICGRFEGVDERVLEAREIEEVSIGDFVLSSGEPAAICLIDAVVRLLPGVVGSAEVLAEESFVEGLLEYPQYTKPRSWEGRMVPDVLLSGNHAKIKAWRQLEAERITRERRPDLWLRYGGRKKPDGNES